MAMPDISLLKPVVDKDVEDIVVFLGLKSFQNYKKKNFITVPLMLLIAQYSLYYIYLNLYKKTRHSYICSLWPTNWLD